jgi:predicted nucleotide-binding protein
VNTIEEPSSHELLARNFEQWQKEYMDEVNAAFLRQDRHAGEVAFGLWEQRFLLFLATEAPSLLSIYRTNVQQRGIKWMFGSLVDKSWKASKGDAVEAFLALAIKEARAQHLVPQTTILSATAKPKTYDLTETQEDLLRQIVASDDAGKTVEKGILLINQGGGEYALWGPKIKLNSLSDLEELCDAGLLVRVSGKDPKYRIRNAARTAVANDFRKEEFETGDTVMSATGQPKIGGKIFIGHGRSNAWRDLKDLLHERLRLEWDEFNRESAAGFTTVARLEAMLDEASFAFLVMTAEDVYQDETLHARENVIHEAGLFQGKLGFKKAIILLEEGCAKFSNIEGLTYIHFPKDNIRAASEEIRRVLEREGILKR